MRLSDLRQIFKISCSPLYITNKHLKLKKKRMTNIADSEGVLFNETNRGVGTCVCVCKCIRRTTVSFFRNYFFGIVDGPIESPRVSSARVALMHW